MDAGTATGTFLGLAKEVGVTVAVLVFLAAAMGWFVYKLIQYMVVQVKELVHESHKKDAFIQETLLTNQKELGATIAANTSVIQANTEIQTRVVQTLEQFREARPCLSVDERNTMLERMRKVD